ncbi:hypothetical protein JR388_000182 [Salmonella enterica subsp. enterica serovar Isangi]|nr:hypothetical protein [Salmonella enterica subsp. enterica serovar Ituri]EFB0402342.1 hypothetical protein [Salmonella enterica]EHC7797956.1 hypothetical protein [Salmonella enterica subsp. enterica serovar Isangi]EHD2000938.1 hypothetical protein [Salmonella enterica subsp. enterica serovar Isangi]EHD2010298.1 hypothetical protein [Salmonella enterica subsp. enterica serovar Isangi]
MAAPSWEDLSVFFDTDDQGGFATVAGLTLCDGSKRDITVIYDDPYQRTEITDGGGIRGAERSFLAKDTDLVNLAKNCIVTVAGLTLYVRDLDGDGTGLTTVYLSKYKKSANDRPGSLL